MLSVTACLVLRGLPAILGYIVYRGIPIHCLILSQNEFWDAPPRHLKHYKAYEWLSTTHQKFVFRFESSSIFKIEI